MYKDNAVEMVVAEMAETAARLNDLSMSFQLCASPLKGEVRRSREPSARSAAADSEKRQFCTTCLFAAALDCKKKTILCFSHRWAHLGLCLRGGGGGGWRGRDLAWQPAVKHQSPAAKATTNDSCNRAVTWVNERIPQQRTTSTEPISKKGIKSIPKTVGNWKRDCAWICSRWQTQPEKICNLQRANQYNVGVDTDLCVAICRFSQVVFVTRVAGSL